MTDYISAPEVLRLQADLRDRFGDLSFCSAIGGQYKYINGQAPAPQVVSMAMSTGLSQSRAYRVEHQMSGPVMDRAYGMADDHLLGEPPCSAGFVVFEEPLPFKEMRGRMEYVHALNWMGVEFDYHRPDAPKGRDLASFPARENKHYGLLVSTWNDVNRGGDEVYAELSEVEKQRLYEIAGGWSCTSIRPISHEWRVGPTWVQVPDEVKADIRADGYEPEDQTINSLRIIAAVFEMLSETIPRSNHTTEELTRIERKQAARNKVSPQVTLVTLRPESIETESHPGTGTPLSLRVPMGNPEDPDSVAYYRTIHKGTPRERRVPVRSHWRGPEDAPLSPHRRVYNLAR